MGGIKLTEEKRRFLTYMFIGGLIIIVIVWISFTFFSPKKTGLSSSNLKTTRSSAIQGQIGGKGSDEYNKKIKTFDNTKADDALRTGKSFLPTPIGNASVTMKKPEDTPPPASPPVETLRRPPVRKRNVTTDNDHLNRMISDLKALDEQLATPNDAGSILYVAAVSNAVTESQQGLDAGTRELEQASDLNVGDLIYAIVDTSVNSDVPSAVMATVVSGKYKGLKLLGKFQRFEERLVLAFSRGVLPTGELLEIDAYAIDPQTTEASVASAVDTHFFSRWGGLVASSFLEGFGKATMMSGATNVYDSFGGTTDQMMFSDYSMEDQLWIAAGKVGEKTSDMFAKNFEKPPTVYLDSGAPIGVLILNIRKNASRK